MLPVPVGRDGDDVIFATGRTRTPVLLRRLSALRPGSTLSREAVRTAVASLAGSGLLEDVQVRILPVPEMRAVERGEAADDLDASERVASPRSGASKGGKAFATGGGGSERDMRVPAPASVLEPVSLAPWSSLPPAEADLVILVREARGGSLGAGGGLSTSRSGKAGLVGQLSAAHSNVLGTGQRLALEADVGLSDSSFKLQHVDPWIAGDSYGTSRSISLLRERVPLAFDPWGVFGTAARNRTATNEAVGAASNSAANGILHARPSGGEAGDAVEGSGAEANGASGAPGTRSALDPAPLLSSSTAPRAAAAASPPASPPPPPPPGPPSTSTHAPVPTVTRSTGAVEWSRRLSRDVSASFALRLARSAVAEPAGRAGASTDQHATTGWGALLGGARGRQRSRPPRGGLGPPRAASPSEDADGADVRDTTGARVLALGASAAAPTGPSGSPERSSRLSRAALARRRIALALPPGPTSSRSSSSSHPTPCDTSATVCWSLSWSSPSGSAGAVAQVAQAAPLLSGWLNYARGTMRAFKNVSLGRHAGLHLAGSLGCHAGDLPPYEAFPLGGTNTVRGYAEGGIGVGARYATGGVELRVPIAAGISGTLFGDVGSLLGTQNALTKRQPHGTQTSHGGQNGREASGAEQSARGAPGTHPTPLTLADSPAAETQLPDPALAMALLPPLEPALDAASAPSGASIEPSGILASASPLPTPSADGPERRFPPGAGAGVGVGVRLDTPLGPLRLEYAWNDRLEPRLHIGVGGEGLKAW